MKKYSSINYILKFPPYSFIVKTKFQSQRKVSSGLSQKKHSIFLLPLIRVHFTIATLLIVVIRFHCSNNEGNYNPENILMIIIFDKLAEVNIMKFNITSVLI